MNDIEYIIFDDNHRAIMENGVLARTLNAPPSPKWMMASEQALTCCFYRIFEKRIFFIGMFSVSSYFLLIQKTNARKYF